MPCEKGEPFCRTVPLFLVDASTCPGLFPLIAHFQFERYVSNPAAWRFVEKARFFPLVLGRRSASASRFTFFNATTL